MGIGKSGWRGKENLTLRACEKKKKKMEISKCQNLVNIFVDFLSPFPFTDYEKKSIMFERPEGIENCRIWVDGCFDFAHHGMFLYTQIAKLC